ncbi:hypothetical protein C8Q79DRAFT_923155 [Trametes meyenii]|nr:hypothetical protein C8Q79DRAFT_923155 [Trametes meyenii]
MKLATLSLCWISLSGKPGLACLNADGKVMEYLWETVEYDVISKESRTLKIPDARVLVEFASNNSFVMSDLRNKLILLQLSIGHQESAPTQFNLSIPHGWSSDTITGLKVVNGGKTALSCQASGEIRIWDIPTRSFRGSFRSYGSMIRSMVCDSDQASAIDSESSGYILIIASATGLERWEVCENMILQVTSERGKGSPGGSTSYVPLS